MNNNPRIQLLLSAGAAVACCLAPAGAPGADIGLNITDGWPTPMLAGETADGLNNWTDSMANMGGGGTNPQLGTITLTGSSVTAKWDSSNTWAAGVETNSEQQLYRAYLDDGDAGSSLVAGDGIGVSVTISGLDAWLADNGYGSYQVRVYASTDWNSAPFQPVDIRAGAPDPVTPNLTVLPILETVAIATLGDGAFPIATGSEGSRGYGDSSGTLTAETITLTVPVLGGGARGTLAGFRITGLQPNLLYWDIDGATAVVFRTV